MYKSQILPGETGTVSYVIHWLHHRSRQPCDFLLAASSKRQPCDFLLAASSKPSAMWFPTGCIIKTASHVISHWLHHQNGQPYEFLLNQCIIQTVSNVSSYSLQHQDSLSCELPTRYSIRTACHVSSYSLQHQDSLSCKLLLATASGQPVMWAPTHQKLNRQPCELLFTKSSALQ